MSCRSYDVCDAMGAARQAEWKYQGAVAAKWQRVSGRVDLDARAAITGDGPPSAAEALRRALEPMLASFRSAVVHFPELPDATAMLPEGVDDVIGVVYTRQQPQPTQGAVQASAVVRGGIELRAFVPRGSTVGRAAAALRHDLLRSLQSRSSVMIEGMEAEEAETEAAPPGGGWKSGAMVLPRRVWFPLAGAVQAADYVLPDEDTDSYAEAIDRVDMLFGLTVAVADLTCAEAPASPVKTDAPPAPAAPEARTGGDAVKSEGGLSPALLVAVAIAMVAAAAAALL